MIYSIFNKSNGKLIRVVQTSNIDAQLLELEDYIEGNYLPDEYYVANKVPVKIPSKPNEYYYFDYNTKEWILNTNLLTLDVLSKRSKLLYASDWTQIPNNPLTTEKQADWATYRQELRDISKQSGYPYNVVWPTPPQG
jgi:hypothetical protein